MIGAVLINLITNGYNLISYEQFLIFFRDPHTKFVTAAKANR